jgi:hypothetical protein
MSFDPTTNRVPIVLLTEEEKKTLVLWPHGLEYYDVRDGRWNTSIIGAVLGSVCRGKPAPPTVTSTYTNVYADSLSTTTSNRRAPFGLRIAVLRIDTVDGVSTAHLEEG